MSEHLDRLALAAVVEPDDAAVRRWVHRDGVADTLRRLQRPGGPGDSRRRQVPGDGVAALRALHLVGARWLVPGDPEWPTQLDDLGAARPFGLWVRGEADLRWAALHSVAVVGARAATGYGVETARSLADGLATAGWSVVSGGAYGIDAAAHRGCLAAAGTSIAVLAGGPDLLQPIGNAALLAQVADSGALVGELPCGVRPSRSRLLARNRLVAALSRATVVVEAADRSGTRRTAEDAIRLGRHLMAVPGPVTSALSVGCHRLLREGSAVLVSSAAEVVELVGPLDPAATGTEPVGAMAAVLSALPTRGGRDLDSLAAATGLSTADLLAELDELHSSGAVTETAAGWRRRRR
jgi:DNA processing protein